jgi:serine/threonine protein kinase
MVDVALLTRNLKTIGGYDLLEKIGEGGIGAVWKARKQGGGDLTAIKLLPPDGKGNSAPRVKRFEQEFRAASRLDHPNIVKVLDFGFTGSVHYLVMELVEGMSLGARIAQQGRLKEPEAIDVILQTAAGLHHAHRAGMIHRDVKPDNILLAANGLVKLTDLGLVKILDNDIDLTRPGVGLGTPNYMAPEQFDNARNADQRCDIYSLGATLYTAVTGQVPFRASTPLNVLKKKQRCELTPPRIGVAGLSEHVERTITRAMNLDPAQRHANCQEFIAELTGKRIRRSSQMRRVIVQPHNAEANWRGRERREHERHPADQEGICQAVASHKEDEWKAWVHDISVNGVALVVSRRFEVGAVLVVWLQEHERETPRRLLVRVVRHQPQSRRKWLLGCIFARPLSEEEMRAFC